MSSRRYQSHFIRYLELKVFLDSDSKGYQSPGYHPAITWSGLFDTLRIFLHLESHIRYGFQGYLYSIFHGQDFETNLGTVSGDEILQGKGLGGRRMIP